jgi:4-hydroxy-tetrahydrodipicolinate synthase
MFHGSIPALVTPFRNGAIDRDAFAALVERQVANGAGAVVPVGTTGETSTLTHAEHRSVVSLCIEVVAGRIPVIAGAGSNSTAEAIALAEHAKTAGADAALSVCPYYNRPDQRGLEAHFQAINDAVALPVFIYNVPGRTVSDILPATVARLARLPNIIGIKDATGDLQRMSLYRNLVGEEQFTLLSGDDPTAMAFCAAGGRGCISVTANVAPRAFGDMLAAAMAGRLDEARDLDARLIGLHKGLFASPSPGPAKYALSRLGLCTGELRLPLVGPDEAARGVVDAAMAAAGLTSL